MKRLLSILMVAVVALCARAQNSGYFPAYGWPQVTNFNALFSTNTITVGGLQIPSQTATTFAGLDASTNLIGLTTAQYITRLASVSAVSALGSGTNVDCSTAINFTRSTTNTIIPFQLTNEQVGVPVTIILDSSGGTAADVKLVASSGRTNKLQGLAAGQTIDLGTPLANQALIIYILPWSGNTNKVWIFDNF